MCACARNFRCGWFDPISALRALKNMFLPAGAVAYCSNTSSLISGRPCPASAGRTTRSSYALARLAPRRPGLYGVIDAQVLYLVERENQRRLLARVFLTRRPPPPARRRRNDSWVASSGCPGQRHYTDSKTLTPCSFYHSRRKQEEPQDYTTPDGNVAFLQSRDLHPRFTEAKPLT